MPCPVCGALYGFHDQPCYDYTHVPENLRFPTNNEQRRIRQETK
jgi:hypothetical protein